MIHIIGGVTRSGKSTVGRVIAERYNLQFLSLDHLMRAGIGFTSSVSSSNHDDYEKALELEPLVVGFLESLIEKESFDYLIEGCSITPVAAKQLQRKHPNKVRLCWIGYPTAKPDQKLNDINLYQEVNPNVWDWLRGRSHSFKQEMVEYGIGYSQKLLSRCDELGIPFIDSSSMFHTLEHRVETVLKLNQKGGAIYVGDKSFYSWQSILLCNEPTEAEFSDIHYVFKEYGMSDFWQILPSEFIKIPSLLVIYHPFTSSSLSNEYWTSQRGQFHTLLIGPDKQPVLMPNN